MLSVDARVVLINVFLARYKDAELFMNYGPKQYYLYETLFNMLK